MRNASADFPKFAPKGLEYRTHPFKYPKIIDLPAIALQSNTSLELHHVEKLLASPRGRVSAH